MAGVIGLDISKNTGLRARYSQNFSEWYPKSHGVDLRLDDGNQSGVGFELFLGYGGGLWFNNEQGGSWKGVNFGYNSLAELSAGILSTRKKWLNSGDDLNNVIETGIYRAGGSTVENNPTTATYFMLIVESFDESSILQKFIHNDGRVWFRSRYGSEWIEWKQIV